MAVRGRLALSAILTLAVPMLLARSAAAQGFFGSAGASVDQGYESNLFATADGAGPGASDVITRVGPSVEGGYRSRQVDLLGRYTLATERYSQYSALNRRIGQQDARLEMAYWPTRQLAVGGAAVYNETNAPQEILMGEAALIYGRVPAQRFMATPALTYDINAAWSLAAEYEFTREALGEDLADNVIHAPHVGLDWRRDPLTTWRFLYRARRFGSPGAPPEMSQAWLVGWERHLSPNADIELQGGARLFDNEVRPEAAALLRNRVRRGEFFIQASQSEMTLLGARGIMNTRSLRAGVIWNIARYVRLAATPSLFHTWQGSASGTVRAVEFESTAYLARGVSFVVSGIAARQRGNLGGPIESIPAFSVRAGVRVLYPGRPREDMARDNDERRDPETGREQPGVRAR